MNAVSAPICIWPFSIRWAPNHSTAHRRGVEDDHDDREGQRHQLADGQRRAGVGAVGHGEALALDVLADEGAHDADAGDLLAQDAVDRVDGDPASSGSAAPSAR